MCGGHIMGSLFCSVGLLAHSCARCHSALLVTALEVSTSHLPLKGILAVFGPLGSPFRVHLSSCAKIAVGILI